MFTHPLLGFTFFAYFKLLLHPGLGNLANPIVAGNQICNEYNNFTIEKEN